MFIARLEDEVCSQVDVFQACQRSSEFYAMDGIAPEFNRNCRAIRSGLTGRILMAFFVVASLPNFAGCAFTRQAILKTLNAEEASSHTAKGQDCTRPDCAAPVENAPVPVMTAFPTPMPSSVPPAVSPAPQPAATPLPQQQPAPQTLTQQPLMQMPTEYGLPSTLQNQIPQQLASGYPASGVSQPQQTLPAAPVVIQPPAVPFGYRIGLIPDPAVFGSQTGAEMPSSAPMLACPPLPRHLSGGAIPESPSPVDKKLTECQSQVEELSQRLSSLQSSTQSNEQSLQTMAAEQMRLKRDNELLRKRAELADKQYLQTLDSLSNMLDDDRPEPAEPIVPPSRPAASESQTRSSQPQISEQSSVLLPTVE